MSPKQEPKTKGTVMGEEIRAKANGLSDAERERLLDKAGGLIRGKKQTARADKR
jgi:hypothetical protein